MMVVLFASRLIKALFFVNEIIIRRDSCFESKLHNQSILVAAAGYLIAKVIGAKPFY
jgi:hypothetical protein